MAFDLAHVKQGDTVRFRNGGKANIYQIALTNGKLPYIIRFENSASQIIYGPAGNFELSPDAFCPFDIIGTSSTHPMLGKRCLVRTEHAGVHIGDVVYAEDRNVLLKNALRLWKWEGGALSLSAVAAKGLGPGSRLDVTGDVYVTEAIELIPTTQEAEDSFAIYTE